MLTHFAPVPDTLAGEPRELYPVLGCHLRGQVIDRAGGVALAVHGHAHHGSEHGATSAGTPVRDVVQHVLGAPYRIYTLARHRTGWRLDQKPEPGRPDNQEPVEDTPMLPADTTTIPAGRPVDDLPAAYWRIMPLHAIRARLKQRPASSPGQVDLGASLIRRYPGAARSWGSVRSAYRQSVDR